MDKTSGRTSLSRLVDNFGREITHLRISVTQRCNLNCFYCHGEGEDNPGEEMSLDQITEIVRCFVDFGVKKIKITGGEPLIRKDIVEIVKIIAQTPGIEDLSLATNGYRLVELSQPLKDAGLDRINIGCDSFTSTVSPKRMVDIENGLLAAKNAGFDPIKLNMVVLKNVNVDEIDAMIDFVRTHDLVLQLIELIPTGNRIFDRFFYPLSEIERRIKEKSSEMKVRRLQGRRIYNLHDAKVEIVSPSHVDFCSNCGKMRVTSDGMIKPCLIRNDNVVEFTGCDSIVEAVKRRTLNNGRND